MFALNKKADRKRLARLSGEITTGQLVSDGASATPTDHWFSIQSALNSIPRYAKPWGETGESRTANQWRFSIPPGTYYISQELTLPKDVNVVSLLFGVTFITPDGVDYALFVDAPNGRFHRLGIHGATFWKCGIRWKDQSRGHKEVSHNLFKDTPDWGILFEAAGGVDFASGGTVGGFIGWNEFERCGGAESVPTPEEPDLPNRPHGGGGVFFQGDQSDIRS